LSDNLIPVCPEVAGGLPTPRIPAELCQPASQVIQTKQGIKNQDGLDITAKFIIGAKASLKELKTAGCESVILKSGSPSCGVGNIYNGKFTGVLTEGNGIFAHMCIEDNIRVISSDDVDEIQKMMSK